MGCRLRSRVWIRASLECPHRCRLNHRARVRSHRRLHLRCHRAAARLRVSPPRVLVRVGSRRLFHLGVLRVQQRHRQCPARAHRFRQSRQCRRVLALNPAVAQRLRRSLAARRRVLHPCLSGRESQNGVFSLFVSLRKPVLNTSKFRLTHQSLTPLHLFQYECPIRVSVAFDAAFCIDRAILAGMWC